VFGEPRAEWLTEFSLRSSRRYRSGFGTGIVARSHLARAVSSVGVTRVLPRTAALREISLRKCELPHTARFVPDLFNVPGE
jgi:hypothetical protein